VWLKVENMDYERGGCFGSALFCSFGQNGVEGVLKKFFNQTAELLFGYE
jgi:hypothetical protein